MKMWRTETSVATGGDTRNETCPYSGAKYRQA